jgi:hypothetical protein
MGRVEDVLEQMLGEKEKERAEVPFVELSVDYRRLRAIFVCSAGENWRGCKCTPPAGLQDSCPYLTENGQCLNLEHPTH